MSLKNLMKLVLPFILLGVSTALTAQAESVYITYLTGSDSAKQLYALNIATLETTRIPTDVDHVHDYAWSPDGTRLVFSNRDAVVVMNADGTQRERLTDIQDEFTYSAPAWSPDGAKIAYIEWGSATPLVVLSLADRDHPLKFQAGAIQAPLFWAHDGSSIAHYSSGAPDENFIVRTGLNCVSGDAACSYPAYQFSGYMGGWSPDDTQVVIYGGRSCCQFIGLDEIDFQSPACTSDPAARNCARVGGTVLALEAETLNDGFISESVLGWAADGKNVLFLSNRTGKTELYWLTPVTNATQRLTHNDMNETFARVSPDGQHIAFGDLRTLYIMNADGTDIQRLLTSETPISNVQWRSG